MEVVVIDGQGGGIGRSVIEALKKEVSKMIEVMYATGGAAFESDLLRRYAWAYFHLGPKPKGL